MRACRRDTVDAILEDMDRDSAVGIREENARRAALGVLEDVGQEIGEVALRWALPVLLAAVR